MTQPAQPEPIVSRWQIRAKIITTSPGHTIALPQRAPPRRFGDECKHRPIPTPRWKKCSLSIHSRSMFRMSFCSRLDQFRPQDSCADGPEIQCTFACRCATSMCQSWGRVSVVQKQLLSPKFVSQSRHSEGQVEPSFDSAIQKHVSSSMSFQCLKEMQ